MGKGLEGTACPLTFIPRSAVEARRKTPSVDITMCKHPKDKWLSHNKPEVTRSKRVGGISSFGSFTEAAQGGHTPPL